MSLFDFFRLVYRSINYLVLVPMVMGGVIFVLTMNEPKSFQSNALIYTGLASGYNIESGSSDKVDYKQINAAYDNLMTIIDSRYTLEEVGLRLLAYNLTQENPSKQFGKQAFDLLEEVIPMDERERFVVKGDPDRTYTKLHILYNEGDPLIVGLIRGESSYSIRKLQSVEVKRIKSSDMVSLSFSTYDAGLCQNTLAILLDVFTTRFKQLKESETGSVVSYFESELMKAKKNLETAEDELTNFRVKSRVINYGEETKALAIKKQNALEEYALRKMNLKATEAALNQLEEKLEVRRGQMESNASIIENKKQLTRVATTVAMMESNNAADSLIIEQLNIQDSLKLSIQDQMEQIVDMESTPEGLPGKQLILDWLNNLIQYNRDLVAVKLFQQRLNDIDQQYDNFTPMGSTIDRMERQISVYEREYLSVLQGLNLARLRAQNIELTSNLEVLDEPQFPLEPEASKRMLLIIAGIVAGFMGTLATVVAGDLLDGSLKKPEKAVRDTGLELAGAFPVMDKEYNEKYSFITTQLSGLLTSKIKLEKFMSEETHRELIVLFSLSPGEGKSTITKYIYEDFIEAGEKALLITPNEELLDQYENVVYYHPDRSFNGLASIDDLIDDDDLKHYKYVLLEIPPLNKGQIPIHVIEKANISLMVARADKAWTSAHKFMIENYKRITGKSPLLILNGVKLHYLDQILGELPLRRSKLVNWIRSAVRFEFTKSGFKIM